MQLHFKETVFLQRSRSFNYYYFGNSLKWKKLHNILHTIAKINLIRLKI